MSTESKERPPFVWVQSIWAIEKFNFVGMVEFSTTKSPTWYCIHFPGSFKKYCAVACWPFDDDNWNCTGLIFQPWTCSTLQIRRPSIFLEFFPSCRRKNRLYFPTGNSNSRFPSTSTHHICLRNATVPNLWIW